MAIPNRINLLIYGSESAVKWQSLVLIFLTKQNFNLELVMWQDINKTKNIIPIVSSLLILFICRRHWKILLESGYTILKSAIPTKNQQTCNPRINPLFCKNLNLPKPLADCCATCELGMAICLMFWRILIHKKNPTQKADHWKKDVPTAVPFNRLQFSQINKEELKKN